MIKLTKNEIKRASTDGLVIISRPDKALIGGYHVMCVRIATGDVVGWPQHVHYKSSIAAAAASIQRDLDKFLGLGGDMSSKGRSRPGIKASKTKAAS